jgi:hypothetical protein
MTDSNRPDPSDPLPESGMGGASDAGAHGRHPASHPEAPALPDPPEGDAAIERRRHHDDGYRGPRRRLGDQPRDRR